MMYAIANMLLYVKYTVKSDIYGNKTYHDMHMYGCELWNLSYNYIKEYKVAWRKIKRKI